MAAKKKRKSKSNLKNTPPPQPPKKSFWYYSAIINPVSFSFGLLASVIIFVVTSQVATNVSFDKSPISIIIPPTPTPIPYQVPLTESSTKPLWLSARAALVLDIRSNTILYQKNINAQLLPASTTKMMTALVALDLFNLDEIITVTTGPESIGHKAELVPGEKIVLKDLLYALLLNSGNDAAVTIAQHHPKGYSGFIKAMNQKAKELNLTNTNFTNASGIDSPYHYSSAKDLAVIGKEVINHSILNEIVSTKNITISSQNGHRHYYGNTNLLLGDLEQVAGIKTGWTEEAGECLVTYTIGDHPRIYVLLGSTDRFGETATLINWIDQNYTWYNGTELTKDQIASHAAQLKLN